MTDWLMLPTELWCQVIGNVHCVFDRMELALTCSRLYGLVSSSATPAPLPAFRSYYEKLVTRVRDQGPKERDLARAKRRRITQQKREKIFAFGTLVRIRDLVMNSSEEEVKKHGYDWDNPKEVFMPYFIELVLNWILITKPSTSVVKVIWERILNYSRITESRLSYGLIVDFEEVVLGTGLYDDLHTMTYPARSWTEADYQNESDGIIIVNLIETFKIVNEIGYCVLDLPIVESEYKKCTTYGGRNNHIRCYTLAIESGYYVVRNTTFEEFHGQCTQSEDCKDDKESDNEWYKSECWFRRHLCDSSKPRHYNLWDPYISLFLNRKEAVDNLLSTMTLPTGDVVMMKVMYGYN